MNLYTFRAAAMGAAVSMAAGLTAGMAVAQEAQGAHVMVELNALDPVENACRISFLIQNGHEQDITKAVYEVVLFDMEGRVDRLTLFDFGALPAARPRVRQFVVKGLTCDNFGRLLINGAQSCEGAGLAGDACTKGLELKTRTDVEVLG